MSHPPHPVPPGLRHPSLDASGTRSPGSHTVRSTRSRRTPGRVRHGTCRRRCNPTCNRLLAIAVEVDMVNLLHGRAAEHIAVPLCLNAKAVGLVLAQDSSVTIPGTERVHDLQILQRGKANTEPVHHSREVRSECSIVAPVIPVMGPPVVVQDLPFEIAPHVADTAVCRVTAFIPAEKQWDLLGLCSEQFHHIPPGWRMPAQKIFRCNPPPGREDQVLRRNGEVSVRRELNGITGE